MSTEEFNKLSLAQKYTLVTAMIVRNAMEDFHAEHLSDAQMKELNPIIRRGIFDAVNLLLEIKRLSGSGNVVIEEILKFHINMIPDYWEVPSAVSRGFVQAKVQNSFRDALYDQSWITDDGVKDLHSTFLQLSEDLYSLSLSQDQKEEVWEHLQDIYTQLRSNGVTKTRLVNARGQLSRKDMNQL